MIKRFHDCFNINISFKKKKNSIRLIRVQLASNEHLRKNDPIVTIYEI